METVVLNNGVEMPMVGLGTFQIPENRFEETISLAYDLGYRKLDTAWKYGNEKIIARTLKNLGLRREDFFITTKIHMDALYYGGCKHGKKSIFNIRNTRSIQDVINVSFDNLDTDYIDLFLIHWPWPFPIAQKIYKVLTKLYHEGRVRAIGVCSALPPHIQALKDVSDVLPAINQFEISPFNTQKKLISYCQEQNIHVEAMSTFSHFRDTTVRKEIFENKDLNQIAKKYDKTVAQLILRWLLQQNISIIPKSTSYEHLKENIELNDFQISEDDMRQIDLLDKGKFQNYDPYATLCRSNRLFGNVPKKYQSWTGFE